MPYYTAAFRVASVNFLFNLSAYASAIFMPLYAESLGASNLQVGFVIAAYGMAYFASALLFGRQSDIHGRVVFIRCGLGLAAVAYAFQIIAPNPEVLLAIRAVVGFCLGLSTGPMMAYAFEAGGRIGSFASFGPLGWLFGSIAAAALRDYEGLFIVSAAATALAFFLSLTLREERQASRPAAAALLPTAKIWANRKIYLPYLLRHLGAAAIWAIFPLFLAAIGASLLWIAILNGISMAMQFMVMRFVQRFNPARLFVIGLLVSALTFSTYALAGHYLQIIPAQILLALAYSCLFVGAVTYLLIRNVEDRGTAVGLLYSTEQLASGLGPFLGGALAQIWGFRSVMYCGIGLTVSGLFAYRGIRWTGARPDTDGAQGKTARV